MYIIVEHSLIASEDNPFKVAIIINLAEGLIESTIKDEMPVGDLEPIIKKELLSKRQGAIIELIKEELPFHLTYSDFWFLTKHAKAKNINKIEELFTEKEEEYAHYLNKTQFIKIYKGWRESLVGNGKMQELPSSPEN